MSHKPYEEYPLELNPPLPPVQILPPVEQVGRLLDYRVEDRGTAERISSRIVVLNGAEAFERVLAAVSSVHHPGSDGWAEAEWHKLSEADRRDVLDLIDTAGRLDLHGSHLGGWLKHRRWTRQRAAAALPGATDCPETGDRTIDPTAPIWAEYVAWREARGWPIKFLLNKANWRPEKTFWAERGEK